MSDNTGLSCKCGMQDFRRSRDKDVEAAFLWCRMEEVVVKANKAETRIELAYDPWTLKRCVKVERMHGATLDPLHIFTQICWSMA